MPTPARKASKSPRAKGAKGAKKPPATRRKADPSLRARRLAAAVARSLKGDKCHEVLLLDLRGRSQVTDYFVIASGTSDRQMHSAAEHVVELAEEAGEALYRSNLDEARANWIILDFVDVVVHIMMPEARAYYDLEMLWGDAPRVGRPLADEAPESPPTRNRAGLTKSDRLSLPAASKSINRRAGPTGPSRPRTR